MADETLEPIASYMAIHPETDGPGDSAVQVLLGPGLIVDLDAAGRVLGVEKIGGPVEIGDLHLVLQALPLHHRVGGRSRALLVRAGMTGPDGEHWYLSTGCWHGDHTYCGSMTGLAGAKRPMSCKSCGARCVNPRHLEEGVVGG